MLSQLSRRNEFEDLNDDLIMAIIKLHPTHRWSYVSKSMKQLYDRHEIEMQEECRRNQWIKQRPDMTWHQTYMWWVQQERKWDPSNRINVGNARKEIDNVTYGFSSYKLDNSFIDRRDFATATLTLDGNYLIMTTVNSQAEYVFPRTENDVKRITLLKWNHSLDLFEFVQHLHTDDRSANEIVVVSRDSKFFATTNTKGEDMTISVWFLDNPGLPIRCKTIDTYYNPVKIAFGNNTENLIFTDMSGGLNCWKFTDEDEPTQMFLDRTEEDISEEAGDDEDPHFDEILITGNLTGPNIIVWSSYQYSSNSVFACVEDEIAQCEDNGRINSLKLNTGG